MKNKLFDFDKKINTDGAYLIGTDEAGRGCGAGDVVAAAVYFPHPDKALISELSNLNDSKQLTEKVREELFDVIINNAIFGIAFGSVEDINKKNILQTSLECMKKACLCVIDKIGGENVKVLVDGNKPIPNFDYEQKFIIKGDGKSACIAAASILAKVSRDRYMNRLSKEFPQYCWDKNKGYLTPEHLAAVDEYGVSKHHRAKYLEKHFARQLSLF